MQATPVPLTIIMVTSMVDLAVVVAPEYISVVVAEAIPVVKAGVIAVVLRRPLVEGLTMRVIIPIP